MYTNVCPNMLHIVERPRSGGYWPSSSGGRLLGRALGSMRDKMGSAPMGSLHFFFLLQRDFSGTPDKPIFIFPKVPGRTLLPHLSNSLLLQRPH